MNIHSKNIYRGNEIKTKTPILKAEFSIMGSESNLWFNTMFTKSLSKNKFNEFKLMLGYTKFINEKNTLEMRTIFSQYPDMSFDSNHNLYLKYSYGIKVPISFDTDYNFENNSLYSSVKSTMYFDIYTPWIIESSIGYNFTSYNQFDISYSSGFADFNTTLLTYIGLGRINIEPAISVIYQFEKQNTEILFSLYFDYIF
ncbi:MAG: hypothetical protein U9N76_02815 [Candidatus Marinimicrobia bacterium]|nr:hypothetical protein [Candidatus Neomarinimicrobiota bacterium]